MFWLIFNSRSSFISTNPKNYKYKVSPFHSQNVGCLVGNSNNSFITNHRFSIVYYFIIKNQNAKHFDKKYFPFTWHPRPPSPCFPQMTNHCYSSRLNCIYKLRLKCFRRGESLSKIISAILSAYLWKNIYIALLRHNNKSNIINFRWEVLLSMLLTSYYSADEVDIIEKQYSGMFQYWRKYIWRDQSIFSPQIKLSLYPPNWS